HAGRATPRRDAWSISTWIGWSKNCWRPAAWKPMRAVAGSISNRPGLCPFAATANCCAALSRMCCATPCATRRKAPQSMSGWKQPPGRLRFRCAITVPECRKRCCPGSFSRFSGWTVPETARRAAWGWAWRLHTAPSARITGVLRRTMPRRVCGCAWKSHSRTGLLAWPPGLSLRCVVTVINSQGHGLLAPHRNRFGRRRPRRNVRYRRRTGDRAGPALFHEAQRSGFHRHIAGRADPACGTAGRHGILPPRPREFEIRAGDRGGPVPGFLFWRAHHIGAAATDDPADLRRVSGAGGGAHAAGEQVIGAAASLRSRLQQLLPRYRAARVSKRFERDLTQQPVAVGSLLVDADNLHERGEAAGGFVHVLAFLQHDLVLDPVGKRDIAKEDALLQHQRLAVLEQQLVLADVVPLLHVHVGQELVQSLAPGGVFGAAQGLFERILLGFQRAAGLGHGFPLAGQRDFHAGLHDIERQQAGADRHEARQQYPKNSVHWLHDSGNCCRAGRLWTTPVDFRQPFGWPKDT